MVLVSVADLDVGSRRKEIVQTYRVRGRNKVHAVARIQSADRCRDGRVGSRDAERCQH